MDEGAPLRVSRFSPSAAYRGGRQIARGLTDLLFPPQCPLTGDPVAQAGTLSPRGWAGLSHLGRPWCPRCGTPAVLTLLPGQDCPGCEAEDGPFGGAAIDLWRSAVHYDEAIGAAILRFKYAQRFDGVLAFARMMTAAGADALVPGAILVPVPLHQTRLRQRQFNQACELARAMARLSSLTVAPGTLRRSRRTQTQKGKNRRARARNVAGAFAVTAPIEPGRPIVLVDDVLTTGATLISCARTLRDAGAQRISAVTLARVALPEPDAI